MLVDGGVMDQETLKETWEELCFYLSDDISTNINENVFEQIVLAQFEKLLKWSKYKGEIKVKPSLQIGRQNYITPDIVIHTPDNKPAVVLEIKRPAEDLGKTEQLGQLLSYMRQTKADFGLLIGKEIHVYYDGILSPNQEPVFLSRVQFRSDSAEGMNFVDIFNRNNFIQKKYETYLRAAIEGLERERRIAELKNQLQSEEISQKLFKAIQQEFIGEDRSILAEAMDGLAIKVFYENRDNRKPEPAIPAEEPQETIFVCKNNTSGKYFIYIDDVKDDQILLINQEGVLKPLNAGFFEEPKEEGVDYLLSYRLVTEKQLETYYKYESQQAVGPALPEGQKKRRTKKPESEGTRNGKKRSPSAYEWSRGVRELSGLSGRVTWRAICEYLRIDVGVDSGRRVLKEWARENRRNWPPIPEPES
jgi:hypothetical protein